MGNLAHVTRTVTGSEALPNAPELGIDGLKID
jgi:hypothetical protein